MNAADSVPRELDDYLNGLTLGWSIGPPATMSAKRIAIRRRGS